MQRSSVAQSDPTLPPRWAALGESPPCHIKWPLPRDVLAARGDELARLARRYGFSNLRVFGSAIQGTDGPGSDLDVLVTRSTGTGLLSVAAFAAEASELLGVEVDVVTDGGLRPGHELLATSRAV